MTNHCAIPLSWHTWLPRLIPAPAMILAPALVIFTAAQAGAANYDIPKVTGITVDGALEDWGTAGLAVEVIADKQGRTALPEDFDPRFRLSWDEQGLALALRVQDDRVWEHGDPAALWDGDSFEWFLLSGSEAAAMLHLAVSPGVSEGQPAVRSKVFGFGQGAYDRAVALAVASVRTETGYQVEARVPWSALAAPPAPGGEIGVQLYVNDVDDPPARFQATWFPQTRTHEHADRVHRLRLAEQASPAIRLRTRHAFDTFGRAAVEVIGIADWTGEVLTARRNDHVTTATLMPQGGRAVGHLFLPMPARGSGVSQVDLLRGGHIVETLHFPDADEARARGVMTAPIGPSRYVIQDAALPSCDFENPLLGQQLLGPYRVETTYYDAAMNVVTAAETPGRYGAVIRILPESGTPVVRYRTVARLPVDYGGYTPWVKPPVASLLLPASLGVDAGALDAQAAPFARHLADGFYQGFTSSPGSAPLLLGLQETPVRGRAAVASEWPETLDRQWWVKMKRVLYYSKKKMDRQFNAPLRNAGEDYPVIRVGTPEEAGVKPDAAATIDAVLQGWIAASGEPFAAAVARKGVVYFQGAYGERDGVPMTLETPSWMASITKLMSGALMMMLVDQGLVGLDDPVGPYLPALDYIDVPEPLTVRRLYTHMNGLQLDLQVPGFHADHWGDEMHDLEEIIAGYYPYLNIGKTQGYNGVGYALGGKIIEMISGEAIPVFFKNHLLDPLEMTHTTVTDTSARAFSTPLDIARFGQMLLNRGGYGGYHFFSPETFEAMLPVSLAAQYGLEGAQQWGIGMTPMREAGLSDKTFGHGAASAATLLIDPELALVIVMTRNAAGPEFSTWHPKFIQAVVDGLATEQ